MKNDKIKIIDYGIESSQYFPGISAMFTKYDLAVYGIGYDQKEAYEDAIDQLYQSDIDTNYLDKIIPKKPRGINKKNKVPAKAINENSDFYYHVGILIKLPKN